MNSFTCSTCEGPIYLTQLTYSPQEIEENELNITSSIYIECRKCEEYFAEYGVLQNGNVIHIDGYKPLETIEKWLLFT